MMSLRVKQTLTSGESTNNYDFLVKFLGKNGLRRFEHVPRDAISNRTDRRIPATFRLSMTS